MPDSPCRAPQAPGCSLLTHAPQEDVINALALTGQVLMGQAVMVKMSEAEKNLAWEAAEQQKAAQKALEVRGRAGRGGARARRPAGSAHSISCASPCFPLRAAFL